jgi:tellurite methyltransferase
MPANVNEWDARHQESAQAAPAEPANIVSEWLPLLPSGPALDILESRARKAKLHVARAESVDMSGSRTRGIRLIQANLEEIRLPENSFSLILCLQYLQRSLFPQMTRALQPGGMVLVETFTRAQLNYSGGPRNPAYLLEPGELRTAFPELHVLFYRELNAGQGIASLVAQKRQKAAEK